jgi:hypothetical protein
MFRYDTDYTEADWRHEADAAELAMLDADARDMQEYPAPLSAMESANSKRYLAWGLDFADEAGPIGMTLERRQSVTQVKIERRKVAA